MSRIILHLKSSIQYLVLFKVSTTPLQWLLKAPIWWIFQRVFSRIFHTSFISGIFRFNLEQILLSRKCQTFNKIQRLRADHLLKQYLDCSNLSDLCNWTLNLIIYRQHVFSQNLRFLYITVKRSIGISVIY